MNCPNWNVEVETIESLKSHYLEHYKSEIMATLQEFSNSAQHCSVCDIHFQAENDLLFHVGQQHLRLNKNLEKMNFESEAETEENTRQTGEENCQYCGKHFDNVLSLLGCYTRHFQTELKNVCKSLLDSEQDQQCPFCSEKFEHFDSLTCHLGTVHLLVNDFLIQEGVRPLVPSNEDYETYFDSREV